MGYLLKQNQTAQPLLFLLVDSADHLTGKTGLTPTVTLSKNGGSFAGPAGSVSEVGHGWYQVAGHATDTNTLGPLLLHAEAVGADPCDDRYDVVAYDPQDAAALGLSRLDQTVGSRLADADYTAPDNATLAATLEAAVIHLPAQIAALNDLSAEDAEAAAAAALASYDPPTTAELTARTLASADYATAANQATLLSRLGAFAGTGVNTVLGFLRAMSRKDLSAPSDLGGTYDPATDSLQGIADTGGGSGGATAAQVWAYANRTLTQTAAQVAEVVRGNTLVIPRGDRVVIALTGLGSFADSTQEWFTIKADPVNDTDAEAIIQVARVGGLLYLNGEPGTSADATLEVDDANAGNITITLAAAATRELVPVERLTYDVQVLFASGPVTRTRGRCDVTADVTRAVS